MPTRCLAGADRGPQLLGCSSMDVADEPRPPETPVPWQPEAGGDGVVPQLWALLRALASSRYRRQLAVLTVGVIVVVGATAAAQIRLNVWQRDFYDALEQRQLAVFVEQLLVFGMIVAGLLTLVVSQTWLQEMTKVRLREWLTHDLLDQWLVPKRAYMLGFTGQIGVNPDQRIHQDAQRLTELTTILGIGLLQSSLLLLSFVAVLWLLSIPTATPARPICASRWCASTSTPTASHCTAARQTSAASSTAPSTAS